MRQFRFTGASALLAAGLALAAAGPAAADQADEAAVLAGPCANCHGPEGRSPGSIPSIAGVPYRVLAAQLAAFKAGEAPDATVMTRLARGYSDAELELLARWFSERSRDGN